MATKTSLLGLTKPEGSDKVQVSAINDNMDIIESAIGYRSRVWNLLDNSDFRNPVNQRGNTTYTVAGYTIDRWIASAAHPVTLTENGVKLDATNGALILRQRLPSLADGVYTLVVKANNHVNVRQYQKSGTAYTRLHENSSYSGGYPSLLNNTYPEVQIRANAGSVVTVEWVALYEGAYTAETLPAYVPKGYTAELLECQRYYYAIPNNSDVSYIGYSGSATQARITIPLPVPMIARPTISVEDLTKTNIFAETANPRATAVSCNNTEGNAATLYCTTSGLTSWKPCVMRFNTHAALSADL